MTAILNIIHVAIAVLLIASIMMQNRSSGLSAAIGGGAGGGPVVQRRGAEKVVYKATIWLAIFFFGLSIVRWYFY